MTKSEASFLLAKNSSEEGSSNGWIGFFREKLMASGRLSAYYDIQRLPFIRPARLKQQNTHHILHDAPNSLAGVLTSNKDGRLFILDSLRFTLLQSPLDSGVLRFSDNVSTLPLFAQPVS